MSKLLIVYAVAAMLAQAEAFATEMRKAGGHRVLIRDAEAWLAHRDGVDSAPENKADVVMIPPGAQFDDLQMSYLLAVPNVQVVRDHPDLSMLGAEVSSSEPSSEHAEGGAGEPPVSNAEPPSDGAQGEATMVDDKTGTADVVPAADAPAAPAPELAPPPADEAAPPPPAPPAEQQADQAAPAVKRTRKAAQ